MKRIKRWRGGINGFLHVANQESWVSAMLSMLNTSGDPFTPQSLLRRGVFIYSFFSSSAGTCITKYRTTECGVLIAVVVVVVVVVVAGPSFRPALPPTLAGLKACRLAGLHQRAMRGGVGADEHAAGLNFMVAGISTEKQQ